MTIEEALKGKRIQSFILDDGREAITFQTDAGAVRLETDGDCCSQTWIESLDDPDALLGTVISAAQIEMPDLGNVPTPHHEYADVVEYYGLKITTERGRCVIDYRNDSNGYYGGWLNVAFVT